MNSPLLNIFYDQPNEKVDRIYQSVITKLLFTFAPNYNQSDNDYGKGQSPSSSEVKDALLNIISGHEFKTPLNHILGFAKLLNSSAVRQTKEEMKLFSEHILQGGYRLKRLSDRLQIWRNLASHSSQGSNAQFVYLCSNELDKEIFSILKEYKIDNFLECDWKIDQCYVLMDIDLFKLALFELLFNAIRFSKPVSKVVMRNRVEGDFFVFEIENTTVYVCAQEIVSKYRVFTQFKRNYSEQQGLGIGIDLAKRLLNDFGGALEFSNTKKSDKICTTIKLKILR